jgi:SNF2 family DNA or RNA helicase
MKSWWAMKSVSSLFPYQHKAIEFQCDKPASALWLDMGLGKTVVTLTSVSHMLNSGQLKAVLVVAPIRVCRLVWRQEAMKWAHTQQLKFSMIIGNKDQRTRGLMTNADVYLVNYENLEWLATALKTYFIAYGKDLPFDGIVFDEISKCKNSSTNRVKALRKVLPHFKWRTGLTGTPAGNGYMDLHGQYLVLDDGHRLGTSKTQFSTRWYKSEGPYKKTPYADTGDQIKHLIGDITLEMSAADYNPLPDMIVNEVEIELPPEVQAKYDQMEKEFFIQLDSGADVEIFNQAALTNKCLQFSSGFMYPIAGMPLWEPIHDAKMDALEDIIEEASGQPILLAYNYRADAERIMKKFSYLKPINLTECKSERSLTDAMARWRDNTCPLMLGHPGSMGHGLDGLQHHGNIIVWFGMNWSLDLYDQFNARLRRQGQGKPVVCNRIICPTTLDMAQVLAIKAKATTQSSLRTAVKEYRLQKNK